MNSTDVFNLLEEIAATSSRNVKEDLLRKHIHDPLVQRIVQLAYDPFVTFGITPPEPPKSYAAENGNFDANYPMPWKELDLLASRNLTGNMAKARVETLLSIYNEASTKLLHRILRKDLRCGITEKTINQVLPGTVPAFDLMLSKPYEQKRIKAWPVAVEPKLDGFRGMNLVTGGVSKAFSRTGMHFPSLDWTGPIVAQMVEAAHARAKELKEAGEKRGKFFYAWLGGDEGASCAIDGEAVAGSFNQTSGDLRRGDTQAHDAILNVFDAVPYAFMRDTAQIEWKVPLKVRRNFLEFIVAHAAKDAPVDLTEFLLANSHEEISAIYAGHRAAGREGAMVKPLDASYVKKKGHLWMKVKPEETLDLRIVGWQTGEPGTRLEGKFATFIVDFKGVHVSVGGMSHALLAEWDALVRTMPSHDSTREKNKIRTLFVGPSRLIEVEFHEVTPDGSLRHPRFIRFRDDKDELLKIAA